MSLLNQVSRSRPRPPLLALIYGVDGAGKSTLGAEAPNPIFLGSERGTSYLSVAEYPTPQTFKDVLAAIEDLTKNAHEFKTLVIDSLDWLEPLVFDQACGDNGWQNIEAPGYGKGYAVAMDYWRKMQGSLTRLRETRKMNVILIGHAQAKTAKDPQAQAEYDRYQLKLNEKAAALWREYVDFVLFMNFETFVKTEKSGKTKAFGEGDRFLYTERRPGFDAKSRLRLPHKILMPVGESYRALAEAIAQAGAESAEKIMADIQELLGQLDPEKDAEVKGKVMKAIGEAGSNPARLDVIRNRLTTLAGVA
jgi:hypothetical protein